MISQSDQPQGVSTTEEARVGPIPPRYWWLKRIGVVAGILLVALFALRGWWGWEANRRMQAEIDKIIAAGEPIYPEDFDPKEEIPDDENAARLLIGADEVASLTSDQQEILQKVAGEPDLVQTRLDEVRGIIVSNAEVFRRLRRARGLPSTDWGLRIRTPAIETGLPVLSGQRNLAKLLYLAAWYQHFAGDDHEALETVRDALSQSRSLTQYPTLIPQLVSWASAGITIRAVEDILPLLTIVPQETAGEARRGVSESQVRDLIAELLDEREAREGMRRAMLAERMYQVDIHNELIRGKTTMSALFGWSGPMPVSVPDVVWRFALGPALTLDVVGVLRETTPFVDAADAASFSGVPEVGDDSTDASGFKFLLHPFRGYLTGSFDWTFELYFRLMARRREAGTALAIRLYEIDHGQRPESLSDLVPNYLKEIPEDPFAGSGGFLVYLPHAAHPAVYSIDVDGVDDGGKPRGSKRSGDDVFFLDGWRPEDESDDGSPTSAQAGEDDDNVKDDEGKTDEEDAGEEKP